MTNIPRTHPRYNSLMLREKISYAMKKGLVHETGLIAHGRGEAFDYLLGEKTQPFAEDAEKVAVAALILARNPVISLNGNVVALVAKECISLSMQVPAKLEVNLFHRTDERVKKLVNILESLGAKEVYGSHADARIPGLNHDRGFCDKEGIFTADTILISLEDGDRCQALKDMDKEVIAIDLNPLSRTAKTAKITIVDNVIRAIPNIEKWVKVLKKKNKDELKSMVNSWDNNKMLKEALNFISQRLEKL
ncbi:MAG: phosphopantothenate/pantothenate synthetase [Thermoplasmatales archaeon]|nr:MAG: phosphopantothenate/pantothenate synthetase [Thermoplasmatales archaeon]